MSNKDKKIIEEQEKLLDHLIEYGGHQYIDEELKKYEELPELEPSKEFDERMNRMFQDAYKKEARREHLQLGKKIAAIAIAVIGVVSAASMNIKAVRQPVLNLILRQSTPHSKTNTHIQKKTSDKFSFSYIPKNYKCTKKQYVPDNCQTIYKYENADTKDIIYIKTQTNQDYQNYINQTKQDSYDEINYKNSKYYYLSSNQNTLLFFKDQTIFSITATKDQQELLKIATHITINK